jgi:hypothetical protein
MLFSKTAPDGPVKHVSIVLIASQSVNRGEMPDRRLRLADQDKEAVRFASIADLYGWAVSKGWFLSPKREDLVGGGSRIG